MMPFPLPDSALNHLFIGFWCGRNFSFMSCLIAKFAGSNNIGLRISSSVLTGLKMFGGALVTLSLFQTNSVF